MTRRNGRLSAGWGPRAPRGRPYHRAGAVGEACLDECGKNVSPNGVRNAWLLALPR